MYFFHINWNMVGNDCIYLLYFCFLVFFSFLLINTYISLRIARLRGRRTKIEGSLDNFSKWYQQMVALNQNKSYPYNWPLKESGLWFKRMNGVNNTRCWYLPSKQWYIIIRVFIRICIRLWLVVIFCFLDFSFL